MLTLTGQVAAEEPLAGFQRVGGRVTVEGEDGPRAPRAGDVLRDGERVVIAAGGTCALDLGQGDEVALFQRSVLALDRLGDGRSLVLGLERGVAQVRAGVGDLPVVLADDMTLFVRGQVTVRRRSSGFLLTVEEGAATVEAAGVSVQLEAPAALDVARDARGTVLGRAARTNPAGLPVRLGQGKFASLAPGQVAILVQGDLSAPAVRAGESFETAMLVGAGLSNLRLDAPGAVRYLRVPVGAGERLRAEAIPADPRVGLVLELLDETEASLDTRESFQGKVGLEYTSPHPADLVLKVSAYGDRAGGEVTLAIELSPGVILEVPPGYRAQRLDLAGAGLSGIQDVAHDDQGGLIVATRQGIVRFQGQERPTWLLSLDPGQAPPTAVAWRALDEGGEVAYLTEGSGAVRTVRYQRDDELGLRVGPGPLLGEIPAGSGYGPISIAHARGGSYCVAAMAGVADVAVPRSGSVVRLAEGVPPRTLHAGLGALEDLIVLEEDWIVLAESAPEPRLLEVFLDTEDEGPHDPPPEVTRRGVCALPPGLERCRLGLFGGGRDLLVIGGGLSGIARLPGPPPFAPGEGETPPGLEAFGRTTWFPQSISSGTLSYVVLSSDAQGRYLSLFAVGTDSAFEEFGGGHDLPDFSATARDALQSIGGQDESGGRGGGPGPLPPPVGVGPTPETTPGGDEGATATTEVVPEPAPAPAPEPTPVPAGTPPVPPGPVEPTTVGLTQT